jgi:transcription initiation factor TFIIIB Brf1 subunit/transcription initiation factor TFIIB
MEKLTIFDEPDLKLCPRCGTDNLDYEDAPTDVVCEACKAHFRIKTVLVEIELPSL